MKDGCSSVRVDAVKNKKQRPLVLPIHTRGWQKPTSGHILTKNENPSPSYYPLLVGPQYEVGLGTIYYSCAENFYYSCAENLANLVQVMGSCSVYMTLIAMSHPEDSISQPSSSSSGLTFFLPSSRDVP
ncbi:hypothetical protein STEG23_033704 [Scotinomys teguina]